MDAIQQVKIELRDVTAELEGHRGVIDGAVTKHQPAIDLLSKTKRELERRLAELRGETTVTEGIADAEEVSAEVECGLGITEISADPSGRPVRRRGKSLRGKD